MICVMRTTIRLDDDLLREAKAYAAATDRTLTRLIEDALREALARRAARPTRRRVRVFTVGGSGPRPGVNLDSNAELLDVMEGLSDPS
jgi:Arc/MetJ family transcription regulator